MVGSSILPIALHNRKLYFLFGKENPLEDSAKGFSDFGGGNEPGESLYETAIREGAEELTGFLGHGKQLQSLMHKHGKLFKINHKDQYHVHIFLMDYDENLPTYYNNNHRFLWGKMDTDILQKSKLFEKIEIEWFTPNMMRERRDEFRPFYREIVDHILKKEPMIRKRFNNKNTTKRAKKTNKHATAKNYLRVPT
jgi:hypothetical protein